MFQIINIFNDFCVQNQIHSFIPLWSDCIETGFSEQSKIAFYAEFGPKAHEIIGVFLYFNCLVGEGDSIGVICQFFQHIESVAKIQEILNLYYCIWYVLSNSSVPLEFFDNICLLCLFLDKGSISDDQLLSLINLIIEKSSRS